MRMEYLEGRAMRSVAVHDLGVTSSEFTTPLTVGNVTYFAGKTGGYDYELWKTDGTAAGTTLVKDIYPGGVASDPSNLTDVDGTLYFTVNGGCLYKSDGTAAGTVLVKSFSGGGIRALAAFGHKLYFAGYEPNDGTGEELWSSDGTDAGTQSVKDIDPGAYGSSISDFTVWNDRMYFFAYPGASVGVELFSSDGTAAGTQLLKDINPGAGNSDPDGFVPFDGRLYFDAYTKAAGNELWSTDGTTAGTVLAKDFSPGAASSNAYPKLVDHGVLYVTSGPSNTLPQTLYALAAAGHWTTVKQFDTSNGIAPAYSLAALGDGRFVFNGYDPATGAEPWVSDGTAAGTHLVKEIVAGNTNKSAASGPFVAVNGTAVFTYYDDSGAARMVASDGTAAGTAELPTGGAGGYTRYAVNGDTLVFNAGPTGDELFAADITAPITPPPPPPTTGGLSGFAFDDANKNGAYDAGEARTSGKTVYLDANANGKPDAGEKSTTTGANGVWAFAGLAAGVYHVRRVFPGGYTLSTPPVDLALAAGQTVSGLTIGSRSAGTPPPPANMAALSGFTFDDTNKNGAYDPGEARTAGKVVFLDADNDGVLDAGEKSVKTAADGTFAFTGLAAGTYHVARVFPTGYVQSTPPRTLVLTTGQGVAGVTIGSRAK